MLSVYGRYGVSVLATKASVVGEKEERIYHECK